MHQVLYISYNWHDTAEDMERKFMIEMKLQHMVHGCYGKQKAGVRFRIRPKKGTIPPFLYPQQLWRRDNRDTVTEIQ